MGYKDFTEQAEITLTLTVNVNGERAIKIQTYNLESLEEQLHKIEPTISRELQEQWEGSNESD